MNPSPKPITVGFGEGAFCGLRGLASRYPFLLPLCGEFNADPARSNRVNAVRPARIEQCNALGVLHSSEVSERQTPSPKRTPVRFGEASTRLKAPAGSDHCDCANSPATFLPVSPVFSFNGG